MTYHATDPACPAGGLKAMDQGQQEPVVVNPGWQRGFEETDRAIWELHKPDLFQHAGKHLREHQYTERQPAPSSENEMPGGLPSAYEERREAINHFRAGTSSETTISAGCALLKQNEAQ